MGPGNDSIVVRPDQAPEATRRFRLSSAYALDFPTLTSGRVMNRLGRVRKLDCELFVACLRSGLIDEVAKLREIRLDILASDREDLVAPPLLERGQASVAVRFDASKLPDAQEDEIRWRIQRAGLLALKAIASRAGAPPPVVHALAAAHASCPGPPHPPFPATSQQDAELFYQYETFSKARKAGCLTIRLAPTGRDCRDHDFQPVFDALTQALDQKGLGCWVGDSQDEIEFRCRDLAAAKAFVETCLPGFFDGRFTFVTDKD